MIATRSKLGRIIAGLALGIAITVAAGAPLGFLAVSYSQVSHELSLVANIEAGRIAKYIYVHQELWQYQTLRLGELTEIPQDKQSVLQQRIFDATGQLVLQTGEEQSFPVVRRSRPIVVGGLRVASVETATSFRKALTWAAVIATFSSLLGVAIFFVIRILPSRMLAELEATQLRYRLLFDANPYPMAVVALGTDRFLAVNDASVEHYGWSREQFLAMTSTELFLPEDMPALMAQRKLANVPGIRSIRGLRHRKRDGAVINVDMNVRPLRFDGVSAILVLSQDVTERSRLERDRKAAEEQLRQSQKMEAVGQLTGGIAHDFNNILTVILANADALQEEEGTLDAATLSRRLEEIAKSVLRAAGLTRQLLAFSRKQALNPELTDLNGLVADTGKLLRRTLGDHIEMNSVLGADVWTARIDQTQLETALVNLCVNARDAMPGGGKLLIATSNATLGKIASAPDVVPGDYVALAVTDNGCGIAPETLAKVFEPFFTTKDVGKGTGLGLSMVYGFIKQSNGHITVDSEPGRGTTFTLYLPRGVGVESPAVAAPKAALPHGSARILVVEDESQVRGNVVRQLQSLGYTVSEAPDGTAAVAAFESAPLPYDLLLTDLMMPGPLGGKALAEVVSGRWPATKVVFMSGYADDAVLPGAGVSLLSKPFRKADLARMIHQVLSAR